MTYTVTTNNAHVGILAVKGYYDKGLYHRTVLLDGMAIGVIHADAMGTHRGRAYGKGFRFKPTGGLGHPTTGTTIKGLLRKIARMVIDHRTGSMTP